MKTFNTTAICIPSKHYMVDISERVAQIKKMVDAGKYFTINRARQYGKTTTLNELRKAMESDYTVASFSFEGITKANFETEQSFVKAFCRLFQEDPILYGVISDEIKARLNDYITRKEEKAQMNELFITLGEWCSKSDKPIVLLIDEVDSATNNQVFLDFLALLRDRYIKRDSMDIPTFQSVILAGVTDIKYIKSKIRDEDQHKVNSPWNIAADFNIDMSLSEDGIRGMLDEYESDHHTGMDTAQIAKQIRDYTNGYPFLVSRICQLIDERVGTWTVNGVETAVKMILAEKNTLFDSLSSKLDNMPEIRASLRCLLMEGARLVYNPDQSDITQLQMYGFVRVDNSLIVIDNRIFETRLYNLFLSDEEIRSNSF